MDALEYLNTLISKGVEFPDAVLRAAAHYDMDADELTELYDNQF